MLTEPTVLIVLGVVAIYALMARWIELSVITLPMIFTGLGIALGGTGLDLVPMGADNEVIHAFVEITLVLVLFSDASGVKRQNLSGGNVTIPVRMLLIGMPLTVALGTLVAMWVSPNQPWALALLVAAILTPTDAALGQSVVSNPNVPKRISQSINIESGLNDGLAFPIVLLAAITAARATGYEGGQAPDNVAVFVLLQITVGLLAGAMVGYGAAKLLDFAIGRNATTTVAQGLYFLSVAFLAYFGAELVGGNGFIAAFVGGLVFGNTLRAPSVFIREFMEGEGQLLTLATFFIFGSVLAPIGLEHASWKTVTLALLFLTVVRMLPIWLSLAGLKLSSYEKIFLGWFGPRGLASILFALLVLEEFPIPGAQELTACVVLTVLISIVLHGVSAAPLSNLLITSASASQRK
ncbi:MAG: cation:proton antiporter [Hyphomicrobiaceae bacterium]|nr:cation:proton antiporter [Hyphomicrobiaceae bacterium]MDX2449121.1 cation:proton antiporter [Hyphomicrobiaceae bacterium]